MVKTHHCVRLFFKIRNLRGCIEKVRVCQSDLYLLLECVCGVQCIWWKLTYGVPFTTAIGGRIGADRQTEINHLQGGAPNPPVARERGLRGSARASIREVAFASGQTGGRWLPERALGANSRKLTARVLHGRQMRVALPNGSSQPRRRVRWDAATLPPKRRAARQLPARAAPRRWRVCVRRSSAPRLYRSSDAD
jgi:hypothetical protein